MSITALRRRRSAPAATRFEKLQGLARDRAEQFGPAARAARHNASERVYQAREWCAPRLEIAAHRVEDTVAPRVASALSATARRVEPKDSRAARRARRRVPRPVLVVGVVAAGAAVAYGVYRARRAAQEAEWQENLDRVREQVRETKDQVVSTARQDESEDEQTSDFNGRVRS